VTADGRVHRWGRLVLHLFSAAGGWATIDSVVFHGWMQHDVATGHQSGLLPLLLPFLDLRIEKGVIGERHITTI
jgi:hypothetical protein